MNNTKEKNAKISEGQADYSRDQVPLDRTFSGFHIAIVMIGGTIAIPVFLMAAQIGNGLGLSKAIPAFLLGSLVLGTMVAFTSYVGARTHYSTYMISEFTFGTLGAKVVNIVIALTLVGWYGVISNVFAQVADNLVQDAIGMILPLWLYVVVGSLLMIWVTASGFNGLDKLAVILVPLMLGFLAFTAWKAYDHAIVWSASDGTFSFSSAVSAIIGSYIVGVVIQPDYSRFARNTKHAIAGAFLALGISFPMVMILCAIPSISTGNGDLIQVMVVLGVGLPAFLLLLLSSWSSNVLNLYSSSLSFATLSPNSSLKRVVYCVGIVGTLIALIDAQDFFVNYLILLGISIPPIASIYIIEILYRRKGVCKASDLDSAPPINYMAFLVWVTAIGFGFFSHQGFIAFTGVAGLDSIAAATFLYLAVSRSKQ